MQASTMAVALACSLGGALMLPRAARAQVRELRYDLALDVAATSIGAAAWIASELFDPQLGPSACRWCDADGLDLRARDALLWKNPATAGVLSDVTAFVLEPAAAFGLDALAAAHDGASGRVPLDLLIVAEATVVAADVNEIVKLLVARERPYVHDLPAEQKGRTGSPYENNMSFYSGHTTEAFALAAAAGTVATMRGYRWAPLVWGVGGGTAVATGYLRMAADAHWLTDVLVGAFVGAGIGVAIPWVFHRPESPATAPAATTPAAASLTLTW